MPKPKKKPSKPYRVATTSEDMVAIVTDYIKNLHKELV